MDENAKLYELGYEKAFAFIIACFETIGVKVDTNAIFYQMEMSKIMTNHGNLMLFKIRQFFTEYLAKTHKSLATVKPTFTSYFVKQMRDAHFNALKNGGNTAPNTKSTPAKKGALTNHEKYINFYWHCTEYQSMPGNPDWVGIYEHLVTKKWFIKPTGFETMTFRKKWEHAMEAVSGFANERFQLTNMLVNADCQGGNLDLSGAIQRIKN